MDLATARASEEGNPANAPSAPIRAAAIEGLWVILVAEDGGKTPMLAKVPNGLFLLGFRTGFTARKFINDSNLTGGEPRMVVAANLPDIIDKLSRRSIAGVVVDYDFATQSYKEALAV